MSSSSIALSNLFDHATGEFPNYSTPATTTATRNQQTQLQNQKHVDIRTFNNQGLTTQRVMVHMDTLQMDDLDPMIMSELSAFMTVRASESWSSPAVVGRQADRNYWYGLSLSCPIGTTSTSCIHNAIDISSLTDSDFISVACPNLPPSPNITRSSCFLDLTSSSSGDFASTTETDSIPFSSSTVAFSGVAANTELRFPISLLVNVDRSSITGVRFRITTTVNSTFRVLAIRAVSANWVEAPIDIDTINKQARLPVPRNGAATLTSAFPVTAEAGLPTDWPILFRSADIPSSQDPRPIDLNVATSFKRGSLNGSYVSDTNKIILYFRECPLDQQTMLDLEDTPMAELDALGTQPDYGEADYTNRTQADLDLENQGALDGDTQYDLERLPDYVSESWIEVKLEWPIVAIDPEAARLTISNTNGSEVVYDDFLLDAINAEDGGYDYTMVTNLEGSTMRVQIFKTDSVGNVRGNTNTPYFERVYDTNLIISDDIFARRKGRFGWWAHFVEGDSCIKSIEARGATYAEVKTQEFQSHTPVEGASLFVGTSAPKTLFENITSAPWGGSVTAVPSKTTSGRAYQIDTKEGLPLQGFKTNAFRIDDFKNTDIRFDLFFPGSQTSLPGNKLDAFLFEEELQQVVPLRIDFSYDKWIPVRLRIRDEIIPPGSYSLIVVQEFSVADTTWFVDNVDISSSSVVWSGRASDGDPWVSPNWEPFSTNKLESGTLFSEFGKGLQISAKARRQDAFIENFKVVPKYAELGRLQFSDQIEVVATLPTATFSTSISGRIVTYTFTGSGAIHAFWDFGDGTTDVGNKVRKTYQYPGDYTATLTAVGAKNDRAISSTIVTIT